MHKTKPKRTPNEPLKRTRLSRTNWPFRALTSRMRPGIRAHLCEDTRQEGVWMDDGVKLLAGVPGREAVRARPAATVTEAPDRRRLGRQSVKLADWATEPSTQQSSNSFAEAGVTDGTDAGVSRYACAASGTPCRIVRDFVQDEPEHKPEDDPDEVCAGDFQPHLRSYRRICAIT